MAQDPIIFTYSPAGFKNDILHYHNSEDVEIYQVAVVPLDLKFNMKSNTVLMFLEMVNEWTWESNLKLSSQFQVAMVFATTFSLNLERLIPNNIPNFVETFIGKGICQKQDCAQMYMFVKITSFESCE